jgi:hypothetical protein
VSAGVNISQITNTIDNLLAISSIEDDFSTELHFDLTGNYPNPFNPETIISFSVDKSQTIQLNILDSRGTLVKRLVHRRYTSGSHVIHWNGTSDQGTNVATGMYFVQLVGSNQVKTLKIILLR